MPPSDDNELLTRYLFSKKNHYRISNKTVRPNAFIPQNGKISVFKVLGLDEQEIWDIGDQYVAPNRGKPVLGRADIEQAEVIKHKLRVVNDEPPPKHANIVDWPPAEPDKSEQLLIAEELAEAAQLYLKT